MSRTINKLIFPVVAFSFLWLFSCTNQENKTVENADLASADTTKEMWAELVESKTLLIKPDSWEDEYWNSVNKKMDKNKIFATLVDAVITGKKQAYDLFTDSLLSIDEVREKLEYTGDTENAAKKINAEDLSVIRMREKWTFDKVKFKIEKQVTRIDFLIKKLDEEGQYLGDRPLFYVNLN